MPRACDWIYSAALCLTTRRKRDRTRKPLAHACKSFLAVLRERSRATNWWTRLRTASRSRLMPIASRRRAAACNTIAASLRLIFAPAASRMACRQYAAALMTIKAAMTTPTKDDKKVLTPTLS